MINKNKMWAYVWPLTHNEAVIPSVGIIDHGASVGHPGRLAPVTGSHMKGQIIT